MWLVKVVYSSFNGIVVLILVVKCALVILQTSVPSARVWTAKP